MNPITRGAMIQTAIFVGAVVLALAVLSWTTHNDTRDECVGCCDK